MHGGACGRRLTLPRCGCGIVTCVLKVETKNSMPPSKFSLITLSDRKGRNFVANSPRIPHLLIVDFFAAPGGAPLVATGGRFCEVFAA